MSALQALIAMLPAADGVLTLEERRAWLQAVAAVFDLMYDSQGDERIVVSIGKAE